MKRSISILGCGWLGAPLAKAFIEVGFSVKGSTTSKSKFPQLKSLGIFPFLIDIDAVQNNYSDFFNSEILIVNIPSKNIAGFQNLIKQIEKSGLKKVLFTSATSVYRNNNNSITEEVPTKDIPLANIERLFSSSPNFDTTIVRFAGLFGYTRNPANFFPEGREIPNPEGFVNMIHQDDCVQIIQQIVFQEIWNEVFNACADTHPKRRAFYTSMYLKAGKRPPVFKEADPVTLKIISNQKLKDRLQYKFKFPDLLHIKES